MTWSCVLLERIAALPPNLLKKGVPHWRKHWRSGLSNRGDAAFEKVVPHLQSPQSIKTRAAALAKAMPMIPHILCIAANINLIQTLTGGALFGNGKIKRRHGCHKPPFGGLFVKHTPKHDIGCLTPYKIIIMGDKIVPWRIFQF